MKGEALFGVPRGRGFAAWGDGDAESTRAHTLSFFPSRGRSMIEMLGVLAIIGVLSAGGIWSYTLAMENHKTNTLINEIDNWVMKSKNIFPKNPKTFTTIGVNNACKLGIVSADYCKEIGAISGGYYYFKSPFTKNSVGWYADSFFLYIALGPNFNTIAVEMYDLPIRACIKLMTKDWVKGTTYDTENVYPRPMYPLPLSTSAAEAVCKDIKEKRSAGSNIARLNISVPF